MKKKSIAILLMMAFAAVCLAGCGQGQEAQGSSIPAAQSSQTEPTPSEKEDKEEASSTPGEAEEANGETAEETPSSTDAPVVYRTADISSQGLMAIYEALGASPTGRVAVIAFLAEPPGMALGSWAISSVSFSISASVSCASSVNP